MQVNLICLLTEHEDIFSIVREEKQPPRLVVKCLRCERVSEGIEVVPPVMEGGAQDE